MAPVECMKSQCSRDAVWRHTTENETTGRRTQQDLGGGSDGRRGRRSGWWSRRTTKPANSNGSANAVGASGETAGSNAKVPSGPWPLHWRACQPITQVTDVSGSGVLPQQEATPFVGVGQAVAFPQQFLATGSTRGGMARFLGRAQQQSGLPAVAAVHPHAPPEQRPGAADTPPDRTSGNPAAEITYAASTDQSTTARVAGHDANG
jgi:hypothetical protein